MATRCNKCLSIHSRDVLRAGDQRSTCLVLHRICDLYALLWDSNQAKTKYHMFIYVYHVSGMLWTFKCDAHPFSFTSSLQKRTAAQGWNPFCCCHQPIGYGSGHVEGKGNCWFCCWVRTSKICASLKLPQIWSRNRWLVVALNDYWSEVAQCSFKIGA